MATTTPKVSKLDQRAIAADDKLLELLRQHRRVQLGTQGFTQFGCSCSTRYNTVAHTPEHLAAIISAHMREAQKGLVDAIAAMVEDSKFEMLRWLRDHGVPECDASWDCEMCRRAICVRVLEMAEADALRREA